MSNKAFTENQLEKFTIRQHINKEDYETGWMHTKLQNGLLLRALLPPGNVAGQHECDGIILGIQTGCQRELN
jgi:hypothetical protein